MNNIKYIVTQVDEQDRLQQFSSRNSHSTFVLYLRLIYRTFAIGCLDDKPKVSVAEDWKLLAVKPSL